MSASGHGAVLPQHPDLLPALGIQSDDDYPGPAADARAVRGSRATSAAPPSNRCTNLARVLAITCMRRGVSR